MCSLQVFKFIYSCRLADMGLATQAFHYCEVIAKGILLQPHSHSPVLISQLVQVRSEPSPSRGQGARLRRGRDWRALGRRRTSHRLRCPRAALVPGMLACEFVRRPYRDCRELRDQEQRRSV